MTDPTDDQWLLPTEIPFDKLKGKDLEECLFWLLDGMGARDVDWRIGGAGAGAADGGRDLEARFYVPDAAGQMAPRKWWIECKGRGGTLEKDAVTSACNNVLAHANVDCLVIATNTTFSNPTRDWVRDWQACFPRPQILLWDRASLERILAQQPATVLRLFEGGLSSAGYLEAIRERFWSLIEYSSIERLRRIWGERDTLEIGVMERVALIANEFAHGNIDERPWCGGLEPQQVYETCQYAFFNLLYLYVRMNWAGANSEPIISTLAYLVLATIRVFDPALIPLMLKVTLANEAGDALPGKAIDYLVSPILDAIQDDLQLTCSADCDRFNRRDSFKFMDRPGAIDTYWGRFSSKGVGRHDESKAYQRLENLKPPCRVGFKLASDEECPLYHTKVSIDRLEPFLKIAA